MNADAEAARARLAAKKRGKKKRRKNDEQATAIQESITRQNIEENIARHERKEQIKGGADAIEVVNTDIVVSREARDLAEAFRSSPISTKDASSFILNSVHRFPTNAKLATYDQFFGREAMRLIILETIGGELSLGLTIELVGFVTGSNNSNFIEYRIVNESIYTPPVPTDADLNDIVSYENGVLHIASFSMPVSRLISAHPSVRKHNKRISEAVVRLLRNRGHVNEDLDTAPLVDDSTADLIRWGCYGVCRHRNDEIFVEKTGFAMDFLERMLNGYDSTDSLKVLCDLSQLDIDTDIAIQLIVERGFEDISNDLDVSAPIKRFLGKFFSRGGGRFGGKDALEGRIVECGLQYQNDEPVIAEGLQFDDNVLFGMIAHILKTDAILGTTITATNPSSTKSTDILSSWRPGNNPKEERVGVQLYNEPIISKYIIPSLDVSLTNTGSNELKNAYDLNVAVPGAKTQEDIYSKAFSQEQDNASQTTIKAFITSDVDIKVLDSNDYSCSQAKTKMDTLIKDNSNCTLAVDLYDSEILTYIDDETGQSIQVHRPFDVSGTIKSDRHSLNASANRLLTVEMSRRLTARFQNRSVEGPMLAIETSMAQTLIIDGLGQDCRMRGLWLREYLAPSDEENDEEAFNKYGGNKHGPIPHYPLYPMANKNKTMYTRKLL